MPAEIFGDDYAFLPRREILTFEEVARLARIFAELGVTKIRITGGEPLLRRELEKLIASLADVPGIDDITLTTNGTLLAAKAEALRSAGLRRITISLDSLDAQVFRDLSGRDAAPDVVLEAIDAASRAGFSPIKVNAVIQRGVNDHTVLDLARHFHGTPHVLRFIEYMDVGTRNSWELAHVVPAREIIDAIGAVMPLEPLGPNYRGEVARRYRYTDGGGEIGVIASVSQPFCGDCTRALLSTDGRLYTCLFAAEGADLRDLLRGGGTDAQLRSRILAVWNARTDRYSELRTAETASESPDKVEMFRIGG